MAEKEEVAVEPAVETPKPTENESIIDNRRAEVEKIVAADAPASTETPEEPPKEEIPKEEPKEDPKEKLDPISKIKKSVQKRIDKVVAQKKSVEEELAETRAELERLKSTSKEPASTDDAPPTIEQVEAYIIRMKEEGNAKEEVAATRYLIKLEKEAAMKEIRDEQEKTQKTQDSVKNKQLTDWTDLQKDYQVYDNDGNVVADDDMNLSNQKGLLYTTALDLYNDKTLHADFYNDEDVIRGFRRAVADAYREIHQQGLIKRENNSLKPLRPREVLADPESEGSEETVEVNNSLSDSDKVREEIKARQKRKKL